MSLIIGILLIAAAVYLIFFGRKKAMGDLIEIQFQQTKTIGEVREAVEAMADIDSSYRELVEIKGITACDNPPETPYSGKKVAFYTAETYKVSEETRHERDANGNMRTKTVKHEDKLSEEQSGEPLLLKDDSGDIITIETNGVADRFDLQKTLDRFEPADRYTPPHFSNPRHHHRDFHPAMNNDYRLLGYKQVEKTFPLNARMYVLGEAYMDCGQLVVGAPRDKKKPFIVSTKSEEELIKTKKSSANLQLIGGIVCAVIGVIAVITQFL